MKEYKVIKIKVSPFKTDLDKKAEELLNQYARRGWSFEQLVSGNYGNFLILSRSMSR